MGYVYYGHFLQYFEVARTELVRKAGMPYREMEEKGMMLPVVNAEITYKKPVRYDELMNITVHIFDYPTVRLTTYYEVFTQESRDPSTLGRVDLVFIDPRSRRPIKAPQIFNDRLNEYIETSHE